ncbi:MAG: hypothetical protein AAGE84_07470 [Cyanobacteria bacterium P01_G01_bin.39]
MDLIELSAELSVDFSERFLFLAEVLSEKELNCSKDSIRQAIEELQVYADDKNVLTEIVSSIYVVGNPNYVVTTINTIMLLGYFQTVDAIPKILNYPLSMDMMCFYETYEWIDLWFGSEAIPVIKRFIEYPGNHPQGKVMGICSLLNFLEYFPNYVSDLKSFFLSRVKNYLFNSKNENSILVEACVKTNFKEALPWIEKMYQNNLVGGIQLYDSYQEVLNDYE